MAKKKFTVTFEVVAEIELDEEVISFVDDEWRSVFYPLHDEEDIAEHIAYNMVKNDLDISQIEGWLMPKDKAKLLSEKWNLEEVSEG